MLLRFTNYFLLIATWSLSCLAAWIACLMNLLVTTGRTTLNGATWWSTSSRKWRGKWKNQSKPSIVQVGGSGMQKKTRIEYKSPARFHFLYNLGHMIKLSAKIHDLSANMTLIVWKCHIYLNFYTPLFRGFCKPTVGVSANLRRISTSWAFNRQKTRIFLYQ